MWLTFIKINSSINDENIIIKYFKYFVKYLKSCFNYLSTIKDFDKNIKIKYYENDYCRYIIPMKYNEDFTPYDIFWVPQMTINIKIVD